MAKARRVVAKTAEMLIADRERRGVGTSTLERVMQADGKIFIDQNGCQVVNQSVLDTLYQSGKISGRQYEAADQLRSDAYEAGMVWSGTSLREPGQRTRADDRMPTFVRRETDSPFVRWSRTMRATALEDSRLLDAIVWPRDSGIDAAQVVGRAAEKSLNLNKVCAALDRLADHYRIR